MASKKYKITWKTFILPALGLVAFFIYLYLFKADFPAIIATIQHIDIFIYSLAIAFSILDVFFFAMSWRFLLHFLSVRLSVIKSFLYVWYGIFMDIIVPAESISGEISRAYLVTREQNGTSGKVAASLITQRLMGMAINITSLLISIGILLTISHVSGIFLSLIIFLAIATTVFLVLLILLCIEEKWTLKIIDAIIRLAEYLSRGRWKLTKVREDVIKAAGMFHNSMKEFMHTPEALFTPMFFSVFAWIFSVGVSYLVFLSMGFYIHWSVIIVTFSIVTAIQAIPIGVPFEAGLPEITMTTLYTLLSPNMTLHIAATATILTRILTVWLRFFIGFAVQQWIEIKAITAPIATSETEKA